MPHRFTDGQAVQTAGMTKKREVPRTPFGLRLFEARTSAGLTQMQVCEKLGIAQGTLAELERKAAGSSLVVHFADLYRVSPRWLAMGVGEMNEHGLSKEALEIALQLDKLKEDPDPERREVAVAQCYLAAFSRRPKPGGSLGLDDSDEASAPPQPTKERQKHR